MRPIGSCCEFNLYLWSPWILIVNVVVTLHEREKYLIAFNSIFWRLFIKKLASIGMKIPLHVQRSICYAITSGSSIINLGVIVIKFGLFLINPLLWSGYHYHSCIFMQLLVRWIRFGKFQFQWHLNRLIIGERITCNVIVIVFRVCFKL